LRHVGPNVFEVHSAGSMATGLNPRAVVVMQEIGIDISAQWSKVVDQYARETFDYVITVCDESENNPCPVFLGEAGQALHVPFEDPAYATGSDEEKLDFFRTVRDQIKAWIEVFAEGIMSEDANRVAARREELIAEMKALFQDDQRRIDHATKVLTYAEKIIAKEEADPLTVTAAAILHDIGIHEAERKHGSPSARFQELEGPPIAREIMQRIGIDKETVDHVCEIVGSHHSAGVIDTPEFRVIRDADWMVNAPEDHPDADQRKMKRLIGRVLKTDTGRSLAEETFLGNET